MRSRVLTRPVCAGKILADEKTVAEANFKEKDVRRYLAFWSTYVHSTSCFAVLRRDGVEAEGRSRRSRRFDFCRRGPFHAHAAYVRSSCRSGRTWTRRRAGRCFAEI